MAWYLEWRSRGCVQLGSFTIRLSAFMGLFVYWFDVFAAQTKGSETTEKTSKQDKATYKSQQSTKINYIATPQTYITVEPCLLHACFNRKVFLKIIRVSLWQASKGREFQSWGVTTKNDIPHVFAKKAWLIEGICKRSLLANLRDYHER